MPLATCTAGSQRKEVGGAIDDFLTPSERRVSRSAFLGKPEQIRPIPYAATPTFGRARLPPSGVAQAPDRGSGTSPPRRKLDQQWPQDEENEVS
jgi:hypothetical protein